MDLPTYLFLNKISKVKFADRVGIHRLYLHHILAGRARPSVRLAKRMEKATFGKVKAEDILSICSSEIDRRCGILDDPRQLDMLKEKKL